MEKSDWGMMSGLVVGRDEKLNVCWKRDGKGGLWVKMRFEGEEVDWVFKGRVEFDGRIEKEKENGK